LNCTVNGAVPEVGVPVKFATGAGSHTVNDPVVPVSWSRTKTSHLPFVSLATRFVASE